MPGGNPGLEGAHQNSPAIASRASLGPSAQDLGCFLQFFLTKEIAEVGVQLGSFKISTTSGAHFLFEAKPPQCH